MQISRHWRLNAQRYRLEGIRFNNGEVSLQGREVPTQDTPQLNIVETESENQPRHENRAEERLAS